MNIDLFKSEYILPKDTWTPLFTENEQYYYKLVYSGLISLFYEDTINIFTNTFKEFEISSASTLSIQNTAYILRSLSYFHNSIFQYAVSDFLEKEDVEIGKEAVRLLVICGYGGFKIRDENGIFIFENMYETTDTSYLNLEYLRKFPELAEYKLFEIEQYIVQNNILYDDMEIRNRLQYETFESYSDSYEYDSEESDDVVFIVSKDNKEIIKPKRKYVEKQYKNTQDIMTALKNMSLSGKDYIGTNRYVKSYYA